MHAGPQLSLVGPEKVSIDSNNGLSIDTPFIPSIDATNELSIDVPSRERYARHQGLQPPDHQSSDLLHYADDPPGHTGPHLLLVGPKKVSIDSNNGESIDTPFMPSIDTPFMPSIDATNELSIDVPSRERYAQV
ncbi:hypothetical protein F2Q68_00035208 [Brassica cretica]|uniref:Uncharacterized protein n=1 Tax=Brassica cretica TaxID=69181 RepID=A0A8S9GVB8_BRACR|nr:hypothetical protein F2Q68_00035208 [Brassica cretica]